MRPGRARAAEPIMPDALPADLTAPVRSRRRGGFSWRIEVAALISVALHAALLGSFWLWARHKKPMALVPLGSPPVVQLVMTPPGGKPRPAASPRAPASDLPGHAGQIHAGQAHAGQATKPEAQPTPRKAPPAAPAKQPEAARADAAAPPPIPRAPPAETAKLPQPSPGAKATSAPRQTRKTAATPPAPRHPPAKASAASKDPLSIDLPEAESDTNAWVTGNDVLPPTADVKFHNRKPSYPSEAALRGEQGTVVLLIHVGADGLVQGVRVLRSSGHPSLDRAAIDAVRTWHFLPSIRNGQPVPSNTPARFVFELD
jgi:protein TonB